MKHDLVRVGEVMTQDGAGRFGCLMPVYVRAADLSKPAAEGLEDALRLILRHQVRRLEADKNDALRSDRETGSEDRAV